MNKRERFLVIVLAALIILLGGFKLLIEPQLKNLSDAKTELKMAQSEKQTASDNITRSKTVETNTKNLEQKINEESELFFPELETDEIQLFFDGLASKAAISFDSFTMASKITSTIEGFTPIDDSLSYAAKDSATDIRSGGGASSSSSSSSSTTSKSDTAKEEVKGIVEKMDVAMRFTLPVDSYNQIKVFLDAIKDSGRTVRISSVDSTVEEQTETEPAKVTFNVSVECFGIKKITDADSISKDSLPKAEGKQNPYS